MSVNITFKQIGVIRTPYIDNAPYQPVDEDEGDFRIVVDEKYAAGLVDLIRFRYMYVIYYIDRLTCSPSMIISPRWTSGAKVGLFASRTAVRPNPIGISIVRIKKIVNNQILTSGLDVFDNTLFLGIKLYVKSLLYPFLKWLSSASRLFFQDHFIG